ncbi:MAG: KpsF/GutQ family sugar-phosphate isomerase [Alphaproteobacteria bacterium]|nr:KpsF/GutQ family sugar-phosphate isomerase [Alphaproteobacteria bacterium]
MNDTPVTGPAKSRSRTARDRSAEADIEAARRVFRLEADALRAMGDALDDTFVRAVELIDGASGRAVVTGMGKSGHIARKISATLASTGTPSLFVHPGEASHGDLGMITRDDAVLALSNSGETPELADVISYCRRFDVPLIAITGRAASTLGENADCTLLLPPVAEACPMGLAPTTSTTAMIAMGDALAIALLDRRGFTAEDFQVLHPGGKLGQSLLRVEDLMHQGDALPLVAPDDKVADALLVMTAKGFGCAGVVDSAGDLVGVITDGDLRRHMSDTLPSLTCGDIMTGNPKTIRVQALASEALGQMNASQITSLFVARGNAPVGILHIHDCLRAGLV